MLINQLFGISLPLIQAPMAGVQDSALAIAVSGAGGLGSLPCAMLSIETMLQQISEIRAQTRYPYNLNFFCHTPPVPNQLREQNWRSLLAPYYREFAIDPDSIPVGAGRNPFSLQIANALDDIKPPVVSFHFGLPCADLLQRVRSWGSKIISSATTLEEARWLQAHGVDAIIAQGLEAGGHRGNFLTDDLINQQSTLELLQQIIREVRLPVIATGGIADAADIARCMAMGAAGVQVGTAFLLCPEATTSSMHRAALKSAAAKTTVLTNLFTGRPARGIENRLIRECGPINSAIPDFPLATAALAPLRAKSEIVGKSDFSPLWSGTNNSGCLEQPAAEITRLLASGFNAESD